MNGGVARAILPSGQARTTTSMDDNPEDLPQLVQRRLQERSKEEPFAADRLGKRPAPHWQHRWPGKRAGMYPAQLDNGGGFWVWFDPLREAQRSGERRVGEECRYRW